MCRKSLSFSIKEIPCPESNRIIGAELSDKKGGRWYIFGVYLPSDNNLDIYAQELTIVENMYHYYSSYGKFILGGDFNGSLLDQQHTNQHKSKLLTKFVMNCAYPDKTLILLQMVTAILFTEANYTWLHPIW